MATGQLKISVFDETIGKPIAGAKAVVSKLSDGQAVDEIITDTSGQSNLLNLETPPLEYSLKPESPTPYGEYVLKISQDGFDDVTISGIQILPDSIANQPVFMKKIGDNGNQNLQYDIAQHTLYGEYPEKIPENEVKELPPATGFVILKEPVIPEYIVVHDGEPKDSSAPNYWIPYKDYIKNVASSEIYATWPTECIKANVLAIISFTLNRVYTEWYRSRGYDFTITSSTAYDHKFIYQRNFFQEISQVVDEIFSTYITRPNIEQPLFTQYCDGVRVSCPNWMTQWGSKDLADDGLSYMEILRNFYGSNIYLENATSVLGVPSSYGGNVLQVGSSGDDVRTIQNQLNAISNSYPMIEKLNVDGVYGNATLNSVKTFQSIFGLPETGSVDYATWYEISKVYTAVKKLA